jgi:hypothetical protein
VPRHPHLHRAHPRRLLRRVILPTGWAPDGLGIPTEAAGGIAPPRRQRMPRKLAEKRRAGLRHGGSWDALGGVRTGADDGILAVKYYGRVVGPAGTVGG